MRFQGPGAGNQITALGEIEVGEHFAGFRVRELGINYCNQYRRTVLKYILRDLRSHICFVSPVRFKKKEIKRSFKYKINPVLSSSTT